MKIDCVVLGAQTCGDDLNIDARGYVHGAADWRAASSVKFDVPDVAKNQRAFYVGREFTLTITLRGDK